MCYKLFLILLVSFSAFFYSAHQLKAECVLEHTQYPEFCSLAVSDSTIFQDFKRHPIVTGVFEIPYHLGLESLTWICNYYPELIPYFDICRQNDRIGNPIIADYGQFGWFSPHTLRYIKVAGDLKKEFGNLSQMHIIEIGGGYGGLCKVLYELGGFASYTIVNLPKCNELTKKYLALQGVENVHFINSNDLEHFNSKMYDLVISNYFFSESDLFDQNKYIKYLIQNTPNGYLTLNFISHLFGLSSLSLNDMIRLLYLAGKAGEVEDERPLSHSDNVLIKWKETKSISLYKNPPKKASQLIPSPLPQQGNAACFAFSGGRLGDNLIAYLHAKWIAYKYSLPLLYTPFPYSNSFSCDSQEQVLDPSLFSFQKQTWVVSEAQMKSNDLSTLFNIPYFPESYGEYVAFFKENFPYLFVDWNDPHFKQMIRSSLAPVHPLSLFELPKNKITVAVHMRLGGGVDDPNCSLWLPLKFPPHSYYIQQIQRIYGLYQGQPLYIHIFTDDLNSEAIVNAYQSIFQGYNIEFKCRVSGNSPHVNVLEDFYMMMQFDCLIRPESNFSIVASKLGKNKIVIYPIRAIIQNSQISITQTGVIFNARGN